jgi:hypothetical protein
VTRVIAGMTQSLDGFVMDRGQATAAAGDRDGP